MSEGLVDEAVLDASVVVKWVRVAGEEHLAASRVLRARFQAGLLVVCVPQLLFIEMLNVAGRRWRWPRSALHELATALLDFNFRVSDPDIRDVADWVERGLTAYDASYVALAQREGLKLITDDRLILSTAPAFAIALADFAT